MAKGDKIKGLIKALLVNLLIKGLKDRTTELNLREPRKNLVCGNVKCFRLEPQDKKTKVFKHDAR